MPLIFCTQGEPCLAIWQITESEEDFSKLMNGDPFLHELLRSITHKEKRRQFLAGRLAVKCLMEHLGEAYEGVERSAWGEPLLPGSGWKCSISHTEGFACALVHPSKDVGIDMEYVSPQVKRIAHKFLNTQELIACNSHHQHLAHYWLAKEVAYKWLSKEKLSLKEHLEVSSSGISGKIFHFEVSIHFQHIHEKLSVKVVKLEDLQDIELAASKHELPWIAWALK